jgi:general secretion pathway protein K
MIARRPRPRSAPRRQHGVALLTALLVVAIATILIAGLLDRGEVSLARAQNVTRGAQADALALGIEDWALDILRRDAASDSGERDGRSDLWAQPLPPTPVPGGKITGVMRDLNGCLNINNLVDDQGGVDSIEVFRMVRLVAFLQLDDTLVPAMQDWVDPDFTPIQARGAEDNAYSGARPAYRTANRAMQHVSEMRLLRGMTTDAYAKLSPHVCALPRGSRVNINTATPEVLASLGANLDVGTLKGLVQRGVEFGSVEDFKQQLLDLGLASDDIVEHGLAVYSEYFQARARIELDGLTFTPVALLQRQHQGGDVGLRVIARGRGAF